MCRRVVLLLDHRRGFRPLGLAESWPVAVQLRPGERWRPGRLRLDRHGVTVWCSRPFRRLKQHEVEAITTDSLVAAVILLRHGWPFGEEDNDVG